MSRTRCFIIGGFSAPAVTFDGSNDYLSKASGPTGLADGTLGLFSVWVKIASNPASTHWIINGGQSGRFQIQILTTGQLQVLGQRSTGAICLSLRTTTDICDGAWHHVLAAWDLSADANCLVYVDGADDTTLSTRTNNPIDYATGDMTIGTPTVFLAADVAELYFTTEWLDLTSSANREKFAKNGRPVKLATDGSLPTGTAPLIYLRGPASNWGTNSGSGGDFTVTGAFTDASTKPSY